MDIRTFGRLRYVERIAALVRHSLFFGLSVNRNCFREIFGSRRPITLVQPFLTSLKVAKANRRQVKDGQGDS